MPPRLDGQGGAGVQFGMAKTIPDTIPTSFIAGETVQWYTAAPGDFPTSEGWTLTYRMAGASSFSVVCTAPDTRYLATITAAASALLTAGDYTWQAFVSKGEETYAVASGALTITAALPVTGAHDGRSHVKITLDALEATIEGKATRDQMQMSCGDRQLARMSAKELIDWYERYRALYQAELAAASVTAGTGNPNKILIRF